LDALLQETIDFYGIAFKQRGMHFQRDGNTMGLTLRVDPYWLRRVLHNLIWNAYKFTPDRGSVSLQVDRNGAGVEISVQDTGSGVSEEDLVRIFNKFEQGGTEKDKERGHGLGLWICKKIVELHGGRIRAESSFGQGSRFCIILPAGAIITR
jgi:Amt family ammonium transporter